MTVNLRIVSQPPKPLVAKEKGELKFFLVSKGKYPLLLAQAGGERKMDKKHFIATHTCFTEEARRMYIDLTKGLTHAEMLEFCKKQKAEMLSQWMGADDFFYCHWYAESEDAIHAVLEELEVDKMCATSVNEMSRFVTAQDKNSRLVGDPDNE